MSHKILINYKGKKSNFISEKPGKQYLIHTIKVKMEKHPYLCATWEKEVRAENSFCVISAKNVQPKSNHEEKTGK